MRSTIYARMATLAMSVALGLLLIVTIATGTRGGPFGVSPAAADLIISSSSDSQNLFSSLNSIISSNGVSSSYVPLSSSYFSLSSILSSASLHSNSFISAFSSSVFSSGGSSSTGTGSSASADWDAYTTPWHAATGSAIAFTSNPCNDLCGQVLANAKSDADEDFDAHCDKLDPAHTPKPVATRYTASGSGLIPDFSDSSETYGYDRMYGACSCGGEKNNFPPFSYTYTATAYAATDGYCYLPYPDSDD